MAKEPTNSKRRKKTKRRTDEEVGEPPEGGAASLIATYGSAEAAILQLRTENAKLRGKNRSQREQIEEYEAELPEGSIVLAGADADAYEKLEGLKEALTFGEGEPKKILEMLKEHTDITAKLSGLETESTLRSVATAAGVSYEVLKHLGSDLEYEVTSVKDDKGKEVSAVSVKYMDGTTQKAQPFKEYAAAKWPDFEDSLYAKGVNGKPANIQNPGPTFVPQTPTSTLVTPNQAPASIVGDYVKKRNAARSGQKAEAKE